MRLPSQGSPTFRGSRQGFVGGMMALAMAVAFNLAIHARGVVLESQVFSDDSTQPFYFDIPAPRGQILDCYGRPLARNVVVHRLMLRVPKLERETSEYYVDWVDRHWDAIAEAYPAAVRPDLPFLKQHFEHRRRLPIPISAVLHDASVELNPKAEWVQVQTEYERDYPGGALAAHVVGYVTAAGPPLKGPLLSGEPLWREVEGRDGLEASMNAELTGHPGLLLVCYDKEGRLTKSHVMRAPVPGRDVVTTLNLPIQAAAEKALASAKRPGAIVFVDYATGNILALASAPAFEPGLFAGGIDTETFDRMKKEADQPLFHRAVDALYPPGSAFKPFVALAGMRDGSLNPMVRIPCGPELMIDGRKFRNWSDTDQGWFDLNSAIVRSCNTYFFQVAINMGDQPILDTARKFGFGGPMHLPLAGVVTGKVPEMVPSHQGLANIAIGQSPLLVTPLEMAMAMAGLADGRKRPHARLMAQLQEPNGEVVAVTKSTWEAPLEYSTEDLVRVHNAMYSVVNHRNGTGAKARVANLPIYGKTGTAQWSRDGEMANAVWFAGFVKDSVPPMAFAIALEGRIGERLFGGSAAAPLAKEVLSGIAKAPKTYAVHISKGTAPLETYDLGNQSQIPIPGSGPSLYDPFPGSNYGYGYGVATRAPPERAPAPPIAFPASQLPGAAYTPRDFSSIRNLNRGIGEVRRAVPVDPSDQGDERATSAMPPDYDYRYETRPLQQRGRRYLSFPVH